MKKQLWVTIFAALGVLALPISRVSADYYCPSACQPACAPATCMVEKTVMVPQMTTEMRRICVTQYRPETRTRRITVNRVVREQKEVTCEYTVMRPELRTCQEQYQVAVPEWREVTTECTVMVPHTEKRTATRTVSRVVPYTETRTVIEQTGHWENRPYQVTQMVSGCDANGCPTCCPQTVTCTQRVWVPQCVQKEIQVTCHKVVCEQQPYEYEVTVCAPETRTETRKICSHRCETHTRDVQYTVYVAEKKIGTRMVCTYQCIPEERDVQCTVMVPYQVEKEVQVCVCHMVAKTIQVQACCPQPATCCPQPATTCCIVAATCCTPAPIMCCSTTPAFLGD